MERYVAFDIGDKRIGVAISDPFNTYALPSQTYFRKGFKGTGLYTRNMRGRAVYHPNGARGTYF